MRRHIAAVLSLVIALVASAILPAAASPSLTQKKPLKIYRSVIVNGVALEAGSYRVELAPSLDSITFLRGRIAVVTVPCRVGVVAQAVTGDTVHYRPREDGGEEIVRIVFAGSSLSIDLGAAVKAGPPIAGAVPER